MAAKKTEATTTYEIVRSKTDRYGDSKGTPETLELEVPSSWKVTFGLVHPGMKGGGFDGYVLRFYEAENKQRAIFRHVQSFRDVSLPLRRKVVTKAAVSESKSDSKGNSQRYDAAEIDEEWEEVE